MFVRACARPFTWYFHAFCTLTVSAQFYTMAHPDIYQVHHSLVINMDTFTITTYIDTDLGEPHSSSDMDIYLFADFIAMITSDGDTFDIMLSDARANYEAGRYDV